MSRIGKIPIVLPKGVEATLAAPSSLTVKGPKGTLSLDYKGHVVVKHQDGSILVERKSDERQDRAYHGLYQRMIGNLVKGVAAGFQKQLELVGVGYRAQMQGKNLILSLGYSHDVHYEPEPGITISTPAPTQVVIDGADKQRVGQVAAVIRGFRPPEPYKGKGIRYAGEHIRRKVGKTGA